MLNIQEYGQLLRNVKYFIKCFLCTLIEPQLPPPGAFNVGLDRGQDVKNRMVAMIDRCQNMNLLHVYMLKPVKHNNMTTWWL